LVRFENVGLRYGMGAEILKDISFSVEPGGTLAIVGPTGSGKSTLLRLLLGLYQPTQGIITYDGIPMNCLEYHQFRSQIGVVLQDDFSFSGTIKQNICLNIPGLPFDDMVRAAQLAKIHESICSMPLGYETSLIEGSTISGGEKQRLAIARAVAHRPKILLLDEATSHLDTQTEHAIQQDLKNLACTKIIIAHRLSTVRDADHIVVLNNGVILEQGSHVQLVDNGSLYAQLVNRQHA